MAEAIFFVVERSPNRSGQSAAIYYDQLPTRLTRKIPRDNFKQPTEPNPIIYALRLDRLDETDPWRTRSLTENYAMYRLAIAEGTALPPGNLADPPKAKGETGTLRGEQWVQPILPRPEGWDQEAADAEFIRKHRTVARRPPRPTLVERSPDG